MTTPYAAELIATANAIVATGKGKQDRPHRPSKDM